MIFLPPIGWKTPFASEYSARLFLPFSDVPKHFSDILRGIALIEEFVEGMSFEAYRGDLKTKAAVERQMQIISEAAYRLGYDADTLCPGPNWSGLRGMGNVLRHAYRRVDDNIVWDTVIKDLPPLKTAVQLAIAGMNPLFPPVIL